MSFQVLACSKIEVLCVCRMDKSWWWMKVHEAIGTWCLLVRLWKNWKYFLLHNGGGVGWKKEKKKEEDPLWRSLLGHPWNPGIRLSYVFCRTDNRSLKPFQDWSRSHFSRDLSSFTPFGDGTCRYPQKHWPELYSRWGMLFCKHWLANQQNMGLDQVWPHLLYFALALLAMLVSTRATGNCSFSWMEHDKR